MKFTKRFPFFKFGIAQIQRQLDNIEANLRNLAALDPSILDIRQKLNILARDEAVAYVAEHMIEADSIRTDLELLSAALSQADLTNGKLLLEFGVWSGRTINHIASHVGGQQTIYGFDSFEGLPDRWRDGYPEGAFKVATLPEVSKNVSLVKGWFENTLPEFLRSHPGDVAFLHIDCDIYSSTALIFELLADRITTGTVIVFDEYFNYPGWNLHEFRAFQDFVQTNNIAYKYIAYNPRHEQVAVLITGKGTINTQKLP